MLLAKWQAKCLVWIIKLLKLGMSSENIIVVNLKCKFVELEPVLRKFRFFWDKEMLIAIHTGKDMFEMTSLFTPALDYKKVQEVICQIYSIFEVIDVLVAKGKQIGKKKES